MRRDERADDEETLKCSEARLWRMVEARSRPDADVDEIDRRIWDLFGEEWSVVFTDLSGFSRRAADFGILHFLQIIYEHKKLFLPIVSRYDGVLVKAEADSLLLLFRRADAALGCSIEMQRAARKLSERRAEPERILLCVGVGFGRILRVGDSDVWGEQVNAASKLGEDVARTDEILVTRAARDALSSAPRGVSFEAISVEVPGSSENFRALYPLEGA